MANFIEKQMEKRPVLTMGAIAIVAVMIASTTGLMGAVSKPVGRAFGAAKFAVMRLFGIERRQG